MIALDIGLFVAGSVVGGATHYWFEVLLRQPKLRASGSSGGRMGEYWGTARSVTNDVRQLSFHVGLPRSMILGRKLRVEFGRRAVVRERARECRAMLVDDSGVNVCTLWWQQQEGQLVDACDIACGDTVSLRTFVWRPQGPATHNRADEYFAYQPMPGPIFEPRVDSAPRFTESMSFTIRISYQFGSKELLVPVKVTKGYDGTLQVQ
jgi:hypothetical protein